MRPLLQQELHARVYLSMSRRPPSTPGNAGCNQHPRATLGWHRGALEPSDGLVQTHSPTLSPAHTPPRPFNSTDRPTHPPPPLNFGPRAPPTNSLAHPTATFPIPTQLQIPLTSEVLESWAELACGAAELLLLKNRTTDLLNRLGMQKPQVFAPHQDLINDFQNLLNIC